MKWLLTYITSSIGKKQIMGATGCALLLFLLGHMAGNLQLLLPSAADAQAQYNTYSAILTKSKLFLYTVEGGLAVIFIIHLYLAITLKLQNYRARGSARYAVDTRKGKKQFPTFYMIWTGLTIATFIIWHLLTVRNGVHYFYINPGVADGRVVRDMWLTTVEVLGNPLFALFYLTLMLVLGFHLWHAISSAFQTMGINHQKWTPIIDKLAIAYCVVVATGFAVTAAWSFYMVNFNEEAKAIIEQAKKPSYQEALKVLHEQPLEEQKRKAHKIAKFPEKAALIVEKKGPPDFKGPPPFGSEMSPEDFMKFKEKHKKGKKKRHHEDDNNLPQEQEEDSEGDEL
ncbi:succinate dehydrogenase cytochrome b subunit [Fibrobacteria bacterium R8-3-H12]